jgi:hypothetical protein
MAFLQYIVDRKVVGGAISVLAECRKNLVLITVTRYLIFGAHCYFYSLVTYMITQDDLKRIEEQLNRK